MGLHTYFITKTNIFQGRHVNAECAENAEKFGLDPVAHCTFESQYASFIKYPIMFAGSLQDTTFLPGALCHHPIATIPSDLLAWWMKEVEKVALDYALEREQIGLWYTSCPQHGVMSGL